MDAEKLIERLKAERDFLLLRSGRAGACSFGSKRWTGASSNALVTVAFGGEDGALPLDQDDLSACYLTIMRLPDHLISGKVIAQLQEGELHVAEKYGVLWARQNADWPGITALQERAALAMEAGRGRAPETLESGHGE